MGSTKYKSVKQEKETAKVFDGQTTPGSGAFNIKGDVTTDEYHIECKTTAKTQYTVSLKTLAELTREAMNAQKVPLLVVTLDDEAKGLDRTWVTIPQRDFLDLVEKARQHD